MLCCSALRYKLRWAFQFTLGTSVTSRLASFIVLCTVLVLSGLANAAEPPKSFRAFTWGSPATGGMKKLSGPTSDGTTLYVPAAGKKLAPLFEIPVAEEAYSFTHGKFYSGSAWLDGRENFDKMKAALTKTFGPSSFSNDRQDLYKWKWPATKIEVHLNYQAKFSRTTVTYLNNAI